MIRLRFVVLHPDAQKLEAYVEDETGRVRRVDITWLSKEKKGVSGDWFTQVVGEIEEQNALAREKAAGRILF